MTTLASTLVGFPPLQARAIKGTFPSLASNNTLSGINTFTGTATFSSTLTATGTTQINTLQIGASGTVGTAEIYPTTASKGKTTISMADNSTNTTTAFSFAAQTGARTYTIPDAGASASIIMSEGAQAVNGLKTFGSVPIGTGYVVSSSLTTITALAGAAKVIFVAPFDGAITDGRVAIDGAISATDITIQLRVNTNAVTNGAMTIANAGSGFGTKASCTPSAANTFVAGDVLNATLTGGVGTVGGALSIYVKRTS